MFRDGLAALLLGHADVESVTTASTGAEALGLGVGSPLVCTSRGHRWIAKATASVLFVPTFSVIAVPTGEPVGAISQALQVLDRASVTSDGVEGEGQSLYADISADGRYVAFHSQSVLVPGDTDRGDVFLRDTRTATTTKVSVTLDGGPVDGTVGFPAVSDDGRYVAFPSYGSNLVTGDTNGTEDVFVRDMIAGTTRRVSVGTGGYQAFGRSDNVDLSADGRFVTFWSEANGLVPGDGNGQRDVFLHDTQTATTTLISEVGGGANGNGPSHGLSAVSADGRYVAFESEASNLVAVDGNGFGVDVFVRDRTAGATTLVSLDPAGRQFENAGHPALSDDGRRVAFQQYGQGDVWWRDLDTGVTQLASIDEWGNPAGQASEPSMSADGRYVGFDSPVRLASSDSNANYDVYVRDLSDASTTLASRSPEGPAGDGDSLASAVGSGPDGPIVAFHSMAGNLVGDDDNDTYDVFRAGVEPVASIEIEKAADQTEVTAGDDIDYNLTIRNTGGVALTGIEVEDGAAPDCGGAVPDLGVGAEHTIDCSYPTVGADVGTYVNTATVTSDQTGAVRSNRVEVEVLAPPPRPDLSVRVAGGAFVGGDVYSSNAAGQRLAVTGTAGHRVVLYVRLQNDGGGTDRISLRGPNPQGPKLVVRYFEGRDGEDITGAVVGRTYRTAPLGPGERALIRVEARFTRDAPAGFRYDVTVRGISDAVPTTRDVVAARLRVT